MGRPDKPRGELPSLLSERVWEPDLLDMWRSPDLAPRVKARLVARDVRSKGTAPPDRSAGQDSLLASPKAPFLIILRQGPSQQASLTRGQRRSHGPHYTTGGGIRRRCLPSP